MKKPALAFVVFVCLTAAATAQTLTPNLPDVAQCRGMLTQSLVDQVNQSQQDPAVAFEQWRRSKRTMMEAPPHIECQSKLWRALKRSSGLFNHATVPNDTKGIGLQTSDPFAKLHFGPMAVGIDASVDPGGGVTEYQGEVQVALNPKNAQQLVAGSNTFYQDNTPACTSPTGGAAKTYGTQSLFGSSDGGATWTYRCAPWPASLTGPVGGASYYYGSDPAVAFDASGNAYAAYMLITQGSTTTTAIVVAKSTDAGNSWSSLGTVADHLSNPNLFDDKEMIAVDRSAGPPSSRSHPGRLYVIWDINNVETIAHSDGGVTWTTVTLPAPGFGSYDIGGDVVVGPDGTVYVIWNRLLWASSQIGEAIVFSSSTDGGNTWTAPATVASTALWSFGTNNTPPAQDARGVNAFGSIDIDRNPASPYYGYLYVAYCDFPSGTTAGTNLNIYVMSSSSGGVAWSGPVKVNDDSGNATQFFPWLSVDPTDGTVNVSWYDTRNDPTASQKTQMFCARSVNGGISFEANVPITPGDTSTAWRNVVDYSNEGYYANFNSNGNQYGDYAGIVAYNRQVHAVWTDSRQFFPLLDTQIPSRFEDMGTSRVVYCGASDVPAAPTVTPICASTYVQVNWTPISNWGTNATMGTYWIYRSTTPNFADATLISATAGGTYTDTSASSGTTYYYFVGARNNCGGTALTPITTPSPASAPVTVGTATTNCPSIAGTVRVGTIPLPGATVSAGGTNATSDPTGHYAIYALAPGSYTVTASATGYVSGSATVSVSSSTYATQDFTLAIDGTTACLTDTSQFDFNKGSINGVDLASSPGDVILTSTNAVDQAQTNSISTGITASTTSWVAQSFVAGKSGALTSIDLQMLLTASTGGPISVELRDDNGGLPGSTLLATASVAAFQSTNVTPIAATFPLPAPIVTAGTKYHIVVRETSGAGAYGVIPACSSGCDPYANGTASTSTDSGSTWSAATTDLYFRTHIATYGSSGTLASAAKNSNPVLGSDVQWGTLSWTATTPAGTSIRFQAAASQQATGPFTMVGPDGTPSTYFTTSGASLSQFNGYKYLQTEAFLSSSDTNVTPVLSDVTACYSLGACTAPATPTITANGPLAICQGGHVTLQSSSVTGNQWYLNGNAIAGATGISYTATGAGSYTVVANRNGCTSDASPATVVTLASPPTTVVTLDASTVCQGATSHTASVPDAGPNAVYSWTLSSGTITSGGATRSITYTAGSASTLFIGVTITIGNACSATGTAAVSALPAPTTPTISGSHTWCNQGTATLVATSSNATSYQWYLNGNAITGATGQAFYFDSVRPANAGTYTVTATSACMTTPQSAGFVVTVDTISATITASGPTTFCVGGSVTLTAPAGYTYLWNNNQTTQSITVNSSGSYYVRLTSANGCTANSNTITVTVNSTPSPSISSSGSTTFCLGGSVMLTASSGYTSYLWSTGATTPSITVSTGGTYTVTVTNATGCPASAQATVTVRNPDATVTASGPTSFCAGGSVTLTAASGSKYYQWYSSTSPVSISGADSINVSAAADYWVVVTDATGCQSTSSKTTVTVYPNPGIALINASGPTTFCAGGSVTLSATAQVSDNYTYLWSTGATTQSISVSTAGSYTVTMTSSHGCKSATSYPTVVTVNTIPAMPTITASGPTTFCQGSNPVALNANAVRGQWFKDGVAIQGATYSLWSTNVAGTYTFAATNDCGMSPQSNAITITTMTTPAQPVIYGGGLASGPYCPGAVFHLSSTATSGNQWFKDGAPIAGATATTYDATTSGSYTVQATLGSCVSPMSPAVQFTYFSQPSIGANGPTAICPGGHVTLATSLANGYQWYRNGTQIGGATGQTYNATLPGDYTVVASLSTSCSVSSAKLTVTTATTPNAAISTVAYWVSGAPVTATVADAGAGATYAWSVTNGTITSGANTPSLTFTAGPPGTSTVKVTVTNASGCSDTKSANVLITDPLQLLGVSPAAGPPAGGTSLTITGTGFVSGATLTVGGVGATNVVVVNSNTITAIAPAHALGIVDVVVKNSNGSTYTKTSSFTYRQPQFDPNGDSVVDPSDIFYLVNYLFTNGPAPHGGTGMISGDANGDGVVDPSDIFYVVNYLFTSGPAPLAVPSLQPRRATSVSGSISLGNATFRDGKLVVPVIVDGAGAQAISLKVIANAGAMTIRRTAATPSFEVTRTSDGAISYLATFDSAAALHGMIAEIEIVPSGDAPITLEFDSAVTTLANRGGTAEATTTNGLLTLRGATIDRTPETPRTHE